MIKEKQNSEELISSLSSDLTKLNVMNHPLKRALSVFLIAVIYMVIAVFMLGLRDDIGVKLQNNVFIFELLYFFVIALSAVICSSWLCVPDVRGAKFMLAIPILLLSAWAMWGAFSFDIDVHKITDIKLHHCHVDSIILGTVPSFAILFFSTQGRTTSPYFMSFMNVMFVGALGYISLRLICLSDNADHICYIHVVPYLLLGIIMAALGRRIYRW